MSDRLTAVGVYVCGKY